MWVNAFLQRKKFQILGSKMAVFLSPFAKLTPRPHHTLIVREPGEGWGGKWTRLSPWVDGWHPHPFCLYQWAPLESSLCKESTGLCLHNWSLCLKCISVRWVWDLSVQMVQLSLSGNRGTSVGRLKNLYPLSINPQYLNFSLGGERRRDTEKTEGDCLPSLYNTDIWI